MECACAQSGRFRSRFPFPFVPAFSVFQLPARHLQISMNMHDSKLGDMPKLEQVIKGVKKEHAMRLSGK